MNRFQIELSNITKSFERPVLKGIDLLINETSYISILGRSGTGKSTLLNILGLVENFDSGSFIFNGVRIQNGRDYSMLRGKNIGFIFQSYNLVPTMTCIENIRLPLLYQKKSVDMSDEWMERLGISHLADQRVNTLSGGEKQRVGIARALMLNPLLILADEPTGNLDEQNSAIIFRILNEEHQKGRAIVMITHNEKAASYSKTVLQLKDGKLYACEK